MLAGGFRLDESKVPLLDRILLASCQPAALRLRLRLRVVYTLHPQNLNRIGLRLNRRGYANPIAGRGRGIAESRRNRTARGLEAGPFIAIMEAGNGHQLALIEPDQGGIRHVFRAT